MAKNTTAAVFGMLFPEADSRRKYDMQETRLAKYLATVFGLSPGSCERTNVLNDWERASAQGCLGYAVKEVMSAISPIFDSDMGSSSIFDVDTLLDELASTSAFSDLSCHVKFPRNNGRSKLEILRSIYTSLSTLDAYFLTQIILKDMRPVLYPIPVTHYTAALKDFHSQSVAMLTKEDAMAAWDPSGTMLKTFRIIPSFELAGKTFEESLPTRFLKPQVGSPIQIPKCTKGQGCAQALQIFQNCDRIWAETKYDGERAQIHVDIVRGEQPKIAIFSKSLRDSTSDRIAIHSVICRALRLADIDFDRTDACDFPGRIKRNIVFEAEMVAFSEDLNRIDEFWRIRSLVENTAEGVRGRRWNPPKSPIHPESYDYQLSPFSAVKDNSSRHLALVFFDVLILDSVSLLSSPYSARRAILESLIDPIPGSAMLADRVPIHCKRGANMPEAELELRNIFARLLSDHQEGVVLKADEGLYNDFRCPWVKLKKDYIPGYGDTVDLVLLGAGWQKDRGRELRVTPGTYTTFYLGALANPDTLQARTRTRPHFEMIFTVSYGLDRHQLEELNFLINNSDSLSCPLPPTSELPYTFTLASGVHSPNIVLEVPVVVEVFGAGFTKACDNQYYELRFPRISKVFRTRERSWAQATTLEALQEIAREAVGKNRPNKDVDDWCNTLWGRATSPGITCPLKRKLNEDLWKEKLVKADERVSRRRILRYEPRGATFNRKLKTTGEAAIESVLKPLGPITNTWPSR